MCIAKRAMRVCTKARSPSWSSGWRSGIVLMERKDDENNTCTANDDRSKFGAYKTLEEQMCSRLAEASS